MGLMLGTGSQDDYVEIVVAGESGAGAIRAQEEIGGTPGTPTSQAVTFPGPHAVDLFLHVDPAASTVQPMYQLLGGSPGPLTNLGAPIAIPASWTDGSAGLAVGLISTSAGPAPTFTGAWDFIEVLPAGPVASDAAVSIDITPTGNMGASTYSAGSFVVTNNSTGSQQIDQFVLDLSTSILPDLVFDPDGTAGDPAGRGFTVDSEGGTGVATSNMLGAHDGGYDALEVNFTDFDPGETITFSIDIDPTSIKGAPQPGPSNSGSVSGLEITGATFGASFDDATTLGGRLFATPGSVSGSQLSLTPTAAAQPTITALGQTSPASVTTANHTITVTGTPGASVRLLRLESGLFLTGVPGGGFDIDPFESNSAQNIQEYAATIGGGGTVDIAVTLSRNNNDSGYNNFLAVINGTDTPTLSNQILLWYPPTP